VLVSVIGVSGDSEQEALARAAVDRAEGGLAMRDLLFLRHDAGARFARVVESFAPDEIVYTDCSADPEHRLGTYRAIAEQVLAPRAPATAPTNALGLHILF
jgi:hypothetical protein